MRGDFLKKVPPHPLKNFQMDMDETNALFRARLKVFEMKIVFVSY